MTQVSAIFVFISFAVGLYAADEKLIRVTGTLRSEIFPGRPNYESIESGDESEETWIVSVSEDGKTEEFQLVVVDAVIERLAIPRASVGKQITIDGFVWEAFSGHHHTPRLLTVKSIQTGTPPKGDVLLAIQNTDGAFSGPVLLQTGFFFFLEQVSPEFAGPLVTGYEYRLGEIVDRFGGGSAESADFLRELDAIGFEPFDFRAEIEAVTKIQKAEAEARGEDFIRPIVYDGGEYEIRLNCRGSGFELRMWNPGYAIGFFAPYSSKVAKLRAVIDLAARHFGRRNFTPFAHPEDREP